ncbi:uncharacterized protein LOC126380416 [Pectinophora gossypiella]|uniref:uncharacterized protein LOC126380416 n=1 Tax=Pectinophora gossypiella TaxID=13191 RepID=UPI00214ED062|nr:uncharacterized protein LOC126380416 [Pectinophora gossypiella]
MWRWVVLCQASTLLVVDGTLDFRFFNQRRQFAPTTQVNCFEYTLNADGGFGKALDKGWRFPKKATTGLFTATIAPTFPTDPLLNINEISKRIDHLLPDGHDILKEHAKLVQDINSLRQVVFVAPLAGEDNRDYDDTIFHEIIETSTTTTARPTTTKPLKPSKQIPIILLGGASQRQVVKSQPLKFPKPTINLVGTSVSPLAKHPYPFVMQANSRKPVKVCMTTLPMAMYPTTTRRPSLWQRILNSLIPR